MRYYVLYVNKSASGEHRDTFAFDTRDEAIQQYHSLMSSAMGGTVINYILVDVTNSAGGRELKNGEPDIWTRPETATE